MGKFDPDRHGKIINFFVELVFKIAERIRDRRKARKARRKCK